MGTITISHTGNKIKLNIDILIKTRLKIKDIKHA